MDPFIVERHIVTIEDAYTRTFLAYEECRARLNDLWYQQRLQIANFDSDEEDVLVEEHELFEQIDDTRDKLRVLEQNMWIINCIRENVRKRRLFLMM